MPTLKPSPYCTYDWESPQAELQAQVFSFEQKCYIQNLIATNAQELLHLRFDPNDPLKFAQQDADCKAQIQILQYLLDTSVSAEQDLKTLNS